MRKSPWGISEPPGIFCIEQAQKVIGGSKPAQWRCGLFIFLVMQGPPSHRTSKNLWVEQFFKEKYDGRGLASQKPGPHFFNTVKAGAWSVPEVMEGE